MSDNSNQSPEEKMVHVQVTEEVREMLGLLKRRYGTSRMTDALDKFLRENAPEVASMADSLIRMQRQSEEDK